MAVEEELLAQARLEAEAIVAEAQDQARQLLEVAERKRAEADTSSEQFKAAGRELAAGLERSIEVLTEVLEELRLRLA